MGDALLHGGGDVAVDATNAREAVVEPFGLGDLGMSSSISQVLWVWRRSWKCMPATRGRIPRLGLPLTAGVQVRRLKVGSAQVAAEGAGEDLFSRSGRYGASAVSVPSMLGAKMCRRPTLGGPQYSAPDGLA